MMTNLFDKTFTVINQIPKSSFSGHKISWEKHLIKGCVCTGGMYDKSKKAISLSGGKFTVYIKDIEKFKPPCFSKNTQDGYYSIPEDERKNFFTLGKGDLIVFDDIADDVPKDIEEYDALIEKYSENMLTVSGYEVFNVKGWQTNHIEAY